jgi:Domain of unknown function (DUF4136)
MKSQNRKTNAHDVRTDILQVGLCGRKRQEQANSCRNPSASVGDSRRTWLLATAGTLSAQEVRYNFMPRTDFSKYRTYKWVNFGGAHPDQVMDAEIKQAVDSQLVSRGLTKTDSDKADLYIGYQTAINQETQWDAWGSRAFGMGSGSWTSSTISVGTLVLDMYDPGTKQLVWTGSATKTIDPGANHEKHMKKLDKAMAKLLKNYPPK